jgi:hypothetical protein
MLNCEPSFCYITPISLLEYAKSSYTHLTLAHLIDQSDKYKEFYAKKGGEGDYIMMDNSAYELKEPYSPDKLLELAQQSGAKAIVLPDYPFQPSEVTMEAAEKFIPIIKDNGYDTFFVPQSKTGDLEDWIEAYEWAAMNPFIDIIGMSILGIPNALSNIDPTYARVVMTQILQDRGIFNFEKHHHYLGLNGGPATEIPSLIRMNAMNTMDSSGPVQSALLSHEYTENADSYMSVKKPKMPVNFFLEEVKDRATHNRIQHNIRLTEKLLNDQTQEVWYAEE